jgi:hypothetical protein
LLLPASALAGPGCSKRGWTMTTPNAGLVARVWASTCDLESPETGQTRLTLRSRRPRVTLRYRIGETGPQRLVRFPANHVVITDAGASVRVTVHGRQVAHLRRSSHHWPRLSARIDVRGKRLSVAVDGHRRRVSLRSPRQQRRIELGKPTAPAVTPAGQPTGAGVWGSPNGSTSRLFAPDSVWNAPFDGNVALDSHSDALVAELQRSVAARNPWINTTSYSVPLYRVGAHQRLVRVQLTTKWSLLQSEWEDVPVPDNALPANGSDGHLVVYQAATDTLWEFYKLSRTGTHWSARWGGRTVGVSKSPGYYYGAERTHGATATSLSLAGGLITIDELKAGRIDHALAMAVPYGRRGGAVWPAQRGDGYVASNTAIPEGTRFRLNPSFDLSTVNGPPIIRMMAEAVQRHGMLVRDQSAGVTFYAEDPRQFGFNPYGGPTGFFQNQYANNMLRRYFPWSQLQVVAPRPPRSMKVHSK